jgi:IS4 transposase
MDLRGSIPTVIKITDAKKYDLCLLDELLPEAGSFYIMDRGYLDFARLYTLNLFRSYFVIRAKSNLQFRRIYSRPIDWACGLRCDQTIVLTGINSSRYYPDHLRRVRFFDVASDHHLTFLTNNFILHPALIAELYKCRWQIELFFRWIKQHLRIKSFFGTSENAVKTQIWTAVTAYLLVAIIKKRLNLEMSLYTFLQILKRDRF